jgi:hypothetical protein
MKNTNKTITTKTWIFIAAVGILFGLQGCMSASMAIMKVATVGSIPDSKYINFMMSSEAEWNEQEKLLDSVSGQVVEDNFAYFYHNKQEKMRYRMVLAKNHADSLRVAFSSSKGLLEPIYSLNANNKYIFDLRATRERHDYLSKVLRLNLLPIESSIEFDKKLIKYANDRRIREEKEEAQKQEDYKKKQGVVGMLDSLSSISFQTKANAGPMRNAEYGVSVLNTIKGDYGYVIINQTAEHYFGDVHRNEIRIDQKYAMERQIQYVEAGDWIVFAPKSYFSEIKVNPNLSFLTSCGANRLVKPIFTMEDSAKNTEDLKINLQSRFDITKTMLIKHRRDMEKACKEGFDAMKITTSIKSNKL